MSKDNIKLTVSAKDQASGTLARVKASTIALGVAAGNLASKAIVGVFNGLRGWVDEALACEKANTMLDAALRGVGAYTPELAQQYRDLASAIQNETGASDEAVKANISALTTLGVMPDKIGQAARAVQSLSAVGYGGTQAMAAVARAIEGDIQGFARLVPAVRLAQTEEEKYAAVNKLLTAGYEQQKANLQTVGGAWEALKGRLGDAREALMGAVFEGARIGTTFDDAQAAVGRFLEGEKFKALTDKLRAGASSVRQIVAAMDTDGGARDVAAGLGKVILAALQDGADYLGRKIKSALGGDKVGGSARFWGALSGGAGVSGALKAMDAPDASAGGGNLNRALAELKTVVKVRAKAHEDAAKVERVQRQEVIKQQKPVIDIGKALERRAKEEQEKADIELRRTAIQEQIEGFERQALVAAENETKAKKKLAGLEAQRAAAAGQNINEWIGARQAKRDEKTQNAKDLEKAQRRADDLERRRKAGTKLSERDRQWLQDFNDNKGLRKQGRIQNAADAAEQFRKEQQEAAKRLEGLQKELLTVAKETKTMLERNLEVP